MVVEGFVSNHNNNSSNGNGTMRDLDMNQPASGGEEEDFLMMGSVEEDEEERGAGGPHRPKKLRLSKEQSRLLEESFRLNHTLSPVSQYTPALVHSFNIVCLLEYIRSALVCGCATESPKKIGICCTLT